MRTWWILVVAGLALRLVLIPYNSQYNYHYDFRSFLIVADAVESGQNVYAATHRYNYAPLWAYTIGGLWQVADLAGAYRILLFKILIVLLLALADVAIAWLLYLHYGPRAAAVVLLAPIAILVSGFQTMFDNVAIALGLWGLHWLDRSRRAPSLALLCLSMLYKHVFFLLPIWLWNRTTGWKNKLILGLPALVFALSFLPFWPGGSDGIRQNVFSYTSLENSPLYQLLPNWGVDRYLFIGGLTILGLSLRFASHLQAGLFYLCALLLLSSSIAPHFLIIPLAFLATHRGWPLWGWLALTPVVYFAEVFDTKWATTTPALWTMYIEWGRMLLLILLLWIMAAAFYLSYRQCRKNLILPS